MKSKTSLAALTLSTVLMVLPSGASAGFVHMDKHWREFDARMHRLMSFDWLCHDRMAPAKKVKAHKHRPMK